MDSYEHTRRSGEIVASASSYSGSDSARTAEGLLLFRNKANSEYLDLEDGNWGGGTVQTWDRFHRTHDHGWMDQVWMVVPVPDDPETCHLINLFYGTFVGVFPEQQFRNFEVKCNPCSMNSENIKWRQMAGSDSSLVVFAWSKDISRCLAIKAFRHDKTFAAVLSGGSRQHWELYRADLLSVPNLKSPQATWMSRVPGNKTLNALNIPATHQSLALHARGFQGEEDPTRYTPNPLDNPRCQNRPPYQQLCAGIRCLDCRFDIWTSTEGEAKCLYAYHGDGAVLNSQEGYTLAALLYSVRLFLTEHPSESVIVRVRNETHTSDFMQAFKNDYDLFNPGLSDPMFFNSGKLCMNTIPLDKVRGKMILLFYGVTEGHSDYGADEAVFWGPRGSTYLEEEQWENPDSKVSDNQRFLKQARNDQDVTRVRRMGWNISTYTWNPAVWFYRNSRSIESSMSQQILGVDGMHRIGLVDFDFCEQLQQAIDNMIRSNQGCGDFRGDHL